MQIFALSQNMNFLFTFLTPTKSCVLLQVIQHHHNTIIFSLIEWKKNSFCLKRIEIPFRIKLFFLFIFYTKRLKTENFFFFFVFFCLPQHKTLERLERTIFKFICIHFYVVCTILWVFSFNDSTSSSVNFSLHALAMIFVL